MTPSANVSVGVVRGDGIVESDRAVGDELQQHHGDERLGQAADTERRLRFEGLAFGSGAARRRQDQFFVVAGERHRDSATSLPHPLVEQTLHRFHRDGAGARRRRGAAVSRPPESLVDGSVVALPSPHPAASASATATARRGGA